MPRLTGLLTDFKLCATTPKRQQHAKQGVQTESTCNMQQCRVRLQGALSSTRNRGYYMAARRSEISLRVLKNISRVSAANE